MGSKSRWWGGSGGSNHWWAYSPLAFKQWTGEEPLTDLKDRLALLEIAPQNRPCPVQALLDQLDPETAELLDRLLLESSKSIRSIHSELTSSGIRIARESLSNYRNGLGRCAVKRINQ